jgi:hypothetical protein
MAARVRGLLGREVAVWSLRAGAFGPTTVVFGQADFVGVAGRS